MLKHISKLISHSNLSYDFYYDSKNKIYAIGIHSVTDPCDPKVSKLFSALIDYMRTQKISYIADYTQDNKLILLFKEGLISLETNQ